MNHCESNKAYEILPIKIYSNILFNFLLSFKNLPIFEPDTIRYPSAVMIKF
jgi:hypothetical protein